jgi:hypothetical protein
MFTLLSVETVTACPETSEPDCLEYEIRVAANGREVVFWAEVRPGPHGDQIDWADEFQDFLLQHDILATDYGKISGIIHQVHCGSASELPAKFGAA